MKLAVGKTLLKPLRFITGAAYLAVMAYTIADVVPKGYNELLFNAKKELIITQIDSTNYKTALSMIDILGNNVLTDRVELFKDSVITNIKDEYIQRYQHHISKKEYKPFMLDLHEEEKLGILTQEDKSIYREIASLIHPDTLLKGFDSLDSNEKSNLLARVKMNYYPEISKNYWEKKYELHKDEFEELLHHITKEFANEIIKYDSGSTYIDTVIDKSMDAVIIGSADAFFSYYERFEKVGGKSVDSTTVLKNAMKNTLKLNFDVKEIYEFNNKYDLGMEREVTKYAMTKEPSLELAKTIIQYDSHAKKEVKKILSQVDDMDPLLKLLIEK